VGGKNSKKTKDTLGCVLKNTGQEETKKMTTRPKGEGGGEEKGKQQKEGDRTRREKERGSRGMKRKGRKIAR